MTANADILPIPSSAVEKLKNTRLFTLEENQTTVLKFALQLEEKGFGESNYRGRGRLEKEGEDVFSTAPGIMSPNMPRPQSYTETSSTPSLINSHLNPPATQFYPEQASSGDSYATEYSDSPFVGAMSGHTFFIVASLIPYLEEHKDDENLNGTVNDIVSVIMSVYAKNGWHSAQEINKSLNTPECQAIFSTYGITIKPLHQLFSPGDISYAINSTQEYVTQICNKRRVHKELLSPKEDKSSRFNTASNYVDIALGRSFCFFNSPYEPKTERTTQLSQRTCRVSM